MANELKNPQWLVWEFPGVPNAASSLYLQILCLSLQEQLDNGLFGVGVTKRGGISIQETKRSDHIFITKNKKHQTNKQKNPPYGHISFFYSVSYVIKQEMSKMQAQPLSLRRCQISHGFQQNHWLFHLFIYNLI